MLLNCSAWEDSWKIPWTTRRSNQSIFKEINPGYFFGRTDAAILWPPDVKSQLTGKGPDAGQDWGQEEKWMTENEMVE